MGDHTKSCQHTHTHTFAHSNTRKLRSPQLRPFIMVSWTLMHTVNPARSNLPQFLGYSGCGSFRYCAHNNTYSVCVRVLHPCVHPCAPPRASMRWYMPCVLTTEHVIMYGWPWVSVWVYLSSYRHVCMHRCMCVIIQCPCSHANVCLSACALLCCACPCVCVGVSFVVWGQSECSEKSVSSGRRYFGPSWLVFSAKWNTSTADT